MDNLFQNNFDIFEIYYLILYIYNICKDLNLFLFI